MKIKNETLLKQVWLLPLCSCFVLLFLARQIHHALQQQVVNPWVLGGWIALAVGIIAVNIVLTRASMRAFEIAPGLVEIEYVSGEKVKYSMSEDRVILRNLSAGSSTLFQVGVQIGKSFVPIAYFSGEVEAEAFWAEVASIVGPRG